MKSQIPTDFHEDRILPSIARILIHPVGGRIVGLIVLILPIIFFLIELPGCDLEKLVLGLLILALPGILFAFIIHEGGHMAVMKHQGAGAHFYWKFPIDMRSILDNKHPIYSNDIFLLRRALAGTLVNLGMLTIFLSASWILSCPSLAFLSFFQGFSSLAATTWSVHSPQTDAGSLRKALSFKDTIKFESWREEKNLSIEIKGYITKREKIEPTYWLLLTGIQNLTFSPVQGSFMLVDDPVFDSSLVILRNFTPAYSFHVQGEIVGGVSCISKCGTIIHILE